MGLNLVVTDKKCPDCDRYLNWLTIARKYNCDYCGWDGQDVDIAVDEGIRALFNGKRPRSNDPSRLKGLR